MREPLKDPPVPWPGEVPPLPSWAVWCGTVAWWLTDGLVTVSQMRLLRSLGEVEGSEGAMWRMALASALLWVPFRRQEVEVTLREEQAALAPYLDIERTRFGPRLEVEWQLAPDVLEACVPHLALQPLVENAIRHELAPDVLEACVPHLALQPLVENAIRHELAPRAEPGRVRISAERRTASSASSTAPPSPTRRPRPTTCASTPRAGSTSCARR